MQGNFKVISLSYKNAPVEIREVIALEDELIKSLITDLQSVLDLSDILVLSTCNRTEIYYNNEKNLSDEIIKILGIKKDLSNMLEYRKFFQVKNDSFEASNHLFRVALGLEAQVIGDLRRSLTK